MEPGVYDPAAQSTCTSCNFAEDMSNYWTAVMFFRHRNGSVIRVPQVGNGGPQGRLANKGGLDAYYIPSGRVTAFKKVGVVNFLPVVTTTWAWYAWGRERRSAPLCPRTGPPLVR